jgi:selenoprotein W-related protein
MSKPSEVSVNIEYCAVCDFKRQCHELKEFLNKTIPEAKVECKTGRRGSFEVTINETLVHSKMQTLAFPVYEDVAENVRNCMEGKEMKVVQQQKITDCCIM